MDAFELAERALSQVTGGDLEPWITDALVDHYTRGESGYDLGSLHYGSDLSPDACERKIVYRLTGAPADPLTLGDLMRFHGGNEHEDGLANALEDRGHQTERQTVIRPMRPSAWAWIGHADILLTKRKHLLEVKAPRAALFARAGTDPKRLVKDSYKWQASAYHHELVRLGRITRTSWVFLDREGSNKPVQVELAGELLVPLDAIIEQERKRNELVLRARDDAPPQRPSSTLVVEVLKGRQKKPVQRQVRATEHRFWGCSYCPYQTTCQPGPETRDVLLTTERNAAEIARAEALWLTNPKAKAKFAYGADPDAPPSEDEEDADEQGTTEVAGHEEAAADPRAEKVPASAAVASAPAQAAGAVAGLSEAPAIVCLPGTGPVSCVLPLRHEGPHQQNKSEPADRDRNTGRPGAPSEFVPAAGQGAEVDVRPPTPTPPAGSLPSDVLVASRLAPVPEVAWDPVAQAARLVDESRETEPACNCGVSMGVRTDHEAECQKAYLHTPTQPAPGAAVSHEGGGPGGSQDGSTAPLSADAAATQSPETPPPSPTPAVCRKGAETWQRHKWHNGNPGCVRCGTPRTRKSPPGPSADTLAPQTPPPSSWGDWGEKERSTAAASPLPAAPTFPSGVEDDRPEWVKAHAQVLQNEAMRELDARATGGGPGCVEDLAQRLEDEREDPFEALGVEDHRDEATDGGGW